MKRASVLIRTKNEERGIGATLDAVFSQGLPPHEVLIIDSGSRDQTLEIASRYPVKILTMSPKGWSYSRALNVAAREATGDFVVSLSAHSPPVVTPRTPPREWAALFGRSLAVTPSKRATGACPTTTPRFAGPCGVSSPSMRLCPLLKTRRGERRPWPEAIPSSMTQKPQ